MKKFNVFLCFVFLILSLSLVSSSNAAYNYLPNQLGGNFTWNQSFAEQLFLLLTTANDPLTDSLEINGNLTVNGVRGLFNSTGGSNQEIIQEVGGGSQSLEEGFNNPSSGSNYDPLANNEPWTDPENITSSNNEYATSSSLSCPFFCQASDNLRAINFGFNVQGTIQGIEVQVERLEVSGDVRTNSVVLTKNGLNSVGDNKATGVDWGTGEATDTYGGSSDLWGTTWTASEINSVNFGVFYTIISDGGTSVGSVDNIRVKVYYLGGGTQFRQVLNSNGSSETYYFNLDKGWELYQDGNATFEGTLRANGNEIVCTDSNGVCPDTDNIQTLSIANQTDVINNNVSLTQYGNSIRVENLTNGQVNLSVNVPVCASGEFLVGNGFTFECVAVTGSTGNLSIFNGTDLINANVGALNISGSGVTLINKSGIIDIVISGGGGSTGTLLYTIVNGTSNQAISTATFTALNLSNEISDTPNWHSSTSNTRVTVNETGLYTVTGQMYFDSSGSGTRNLFVRVNGDDGFRYGADQFQVSETGAYSGEVAIELELEANDYVELVAFQNTGVNLDSLAVLGSPYLSVKKNDVLTSGGGGSGNAPQMNGVHLTNSTGSSPNNAWQTIYFPSETWDDANFHNTAGINDSYILMDNNNTCRIELLAEVYWDTNTADERVIRILRGGVTQLGYEMRPPINWFGITSATNKLNLFDQATPDTTYEVQVFQSSGGTRTITGNTFTGQCVRTF